MRVVLLTIALLAAAFVQADSLPEQFKQGLKSLVTDELILRNQSPVQTFHVGTKDEPREIVIYWPENRMVFLCGDMDLSDSRWERLLLACNIPIDLDTDVVRSVEDIGTSNYLLTNDEIVELIRSAKGGFSVAMNSPK